MSDEQLHEHILASLRDLSAKMEAHSLESRSRVDTLREHIDQRTEAIRERKEEDHAEIHRRIDAVLEKTEETASKVTKIHGWAAGASFVGGILGMVIGWLISLWKH